MIYENLSIYNFNLTTKEEALVLMEFTDSKHELLFPYYERNFSVFPEDRAYVEERFVTKSKENILTENDPSAMNQYIYWYKPHDLEDLIEIINRDGITYRCIVVPKNEEVEKYRFKLFIYEHAVYQGEETRALWINESVENDYKNHIYPKINSKI